jgi:predicted KAP-like P-loop ATPase
MAFLGDCMTGDNSVDDDNLGDANFNDNAIATPEADLYGVNPFALMLAKRIANLKGSVGSTIAINGPWGSGKSSIVNLIRHHLRPYEKNSELVVVNFTSWWFRGEEALTMSFLQELEAVCKKTLGSRAKNIFKKARRRFMVGAAFSDWIRTAGQEDWKKATAQFASRYLTDAQTLEEVFERLGELLKAQDKRIVVIMDDLDRLTPEEQLQMFRLVKSVGRLPRVLYLLIFDREIAEREIRRKFPSEGPHFLEKIIQANFDIPPPERDVLNQVLYSRIQEACGDHSEIDHEYFFNTFHSAVAPYITVPRHVIRLANAMAITFPPIKGEVNLADYLAVETMRLFEPTLYDKVRRSKDALCGSSDKGDQNGERIKPFLEGVPEDRREIASEVLARLFPRLQDMGYGPDSHATWEENRQICAKKYFDTYFRLQVGDHILSREDLDRFIAHADDVGYVKRTLLDAAKTRRRNGRSAIPVWLDELNSHANRIREQDVGPLLIGLFVVADELIAADPRDPRLDLFDNRVRIHWVVRKLVGHRFTLPERTKLLMEASKVASLGWLVHLAGSAWEDHHPKKGPPESAEKCLVEASAAGDLRVAALAAIRAAAVSGELMSHDKLGWLLFRWIEFAVDDGKEAKAWVAEQLKTNQGVVAMADVFTNEKFSQGLPMFGGPIDYVGRTTTYIDTEAMNSLLDPVEFRKRLNEVHKSQALSEGDKLKVKKAVEAWDRNGKGNDDGDD